MKISSLIASGSALLLASSVTMGSMYVTLSAASSNEARQAAEQLASTSDAVETSAPVQDSPAEQSVTSDALSAEPQTIDVQIAEDGSLSGRLRHIGGDDGDLVPVPSTDVQLLQGGVSIGEATTDDEGLFVIQGVAPGIYNVVTDSSTGYAVFSVRAVGQSDVVASRNEATTVSRVIADFQMDVAAVHPDDIEKVKQIIAENYVTESASDSPGQFTRHSEGTASGRSVSTAAWSHNISLSPDGRLLGTILSVDPATGQSATVENLSVYFVMDQEIVSTAVVTPSGTFEAEGLQPGPCSIVAAGKDGVLAVGVFLEAADTEATASIESEFTPVKLRAGSSFPGMMIAKGVGNSALGVPGTQGNSSGNSPANSNAVAGVSPPPGGFGPGGFGGGAGGGGFAGGAGGGAGLGGAGGLGGLLTAGALGAAALVANNNNNNNNQTSK
jgi:hypothetical protein